MDHVHVIITHNHSDSDRQLSVLQPGAPTGKVRLLAPGQSVGMVCDSPITVQPGGLVNPPEPEPTDIEALECETRAVGLITSAFQRIRMLAKEQAAEALDRKEAQATVRNEDGSPLRIRFDADQRDDFIERAAVVAGRRLEDALIALALPDPKELAADADFRKRIEAMQKEVADSLAGARASVRSTAEASRLADQRAWVMETIDLLAMSGMLGTGIGTGVSTADAFAAVNARRQAAGLAPL